MKREKYFDLMIEGKGHFPIGITERDITNHGGYNEEETAILLAMDCDLIDIETERFSITEISKKDYLDYTFLQKLNPFPIKYALP